ncbi:hypothetical protein GCM10022269_13660 [Sphingorhabdus rigui]
MAHGEPVKPADQSAIDPTFHAVRAALCMQLAKGFFDIGVYPRLAPIVLRLGACCDNLGKGGIRRDGKPPLPDRFRQ